MPDEDEAPVVDIGNPGHRNSPPDLTPEEVVGRHHILADPLPWRDPSIRRMTDHRIGNHLQNMIHTATWSTALAFVNDALDSQPPSMPPLAFGAFGFELMDILRPCIAAECVFGSHTCLGDSAAHITHDHDALACNPEAELMVDQRDNTPYLAIATWFATHHADRYRQLDEDDEANERRRLVAQ